ncbi:MAG TPA: type II toxin-antitoxin system CcdA family antitoxin [Azospirillaceae bacterium]|nr:type II toxin-antitoxin system CcdA family antitoxin [Azospirillaceae bacterium]
MPLSATTRPERRRRPTNISLDERLLSAAKAHGLNVSRIAEEALARAVQDKEREAWLKENAEAIAEQNRLAAEEGAFGDDVRTF